MRYLIVKNGLVIGSADLDHSESIVGAEGTGGGVNEKGILTHWNPPAGCIAVRNEPTMRDTPLASEGWAWDGSAFKAPA